MRVFVALLMAVVGVTSAVAANIENKFIHRTGQEGSVYFIFSQPMPLQSATARCDKKMVYDCTYVEQTDSVTVLATLTTADSYMPQGAVMVSPCVDKEITVPVEMLYVKPRKGRYVYRLRFVMPFAEFIEVFECSVAPKLTYRFDRADYSYEYGAKEWSKRAGDMRQIVNLIKMNKK